MARSTVAEVLATDLYFGEGPRWHDDRLWFSDFYDHAVKTLDLDGRIEVAVELDGQPSGLGWLPDGRLLVVSMLDRKVLRQEADGLVEHADLSGVAAFHANDMVVDAGGRAYVGNFGFDLHRFEREQGGRALYTEPLPPMAVLARVEPDGTVEVAAEDLRFPNGAVITPDGRTLIVGETLGRRLTAFDIDPDGRLAGRRVWAELERRLPDGICLDASGHIWVANPIAPECYLVAEGGEVLDVVVTDQRCYACMLGGPEGRHLFMLTAAASDPEVAAASRTGHVLVATVDVPHAGRP